MTDFSHNGHSEGDIVVPDEIRSTTPLPADRWEFLKVVHALVAAETEPGAVGTAVGAFTHLSIRTERVDAHLLVEEFEDEPEAYLTRQWGPLPGATEIDSGTGRRLLHLALERSEGGDEHDAEEGALGAGPPYLCTESGSGLWRRADVMRYRRKMDAPVWMVPAVTFHYLAT